MSQPRLLFDEDVDGRIVNGLISRVPASQIRTVQSEGLLQQHDIMILAWAANRGYMIATQDSHTMTMFAFERVARGDPMPGIIIIPRWMGIGLAIDDLALILGASDAEEWVDRVFFLPIRS